jgi:hypothetical protein
MWTFWESCNPELCNTTEYTCALFQVSCLGVEAPVEGEAGRLVLTSRGADGTVVRYVLQAASPEVCRAWVNDVGQILENQRNFLNGRIGEILIEKHNSFTFRIHI